MKFGQGINIWIQQSNIRHHFNDFFHSHAWIYPRSRSYPTLSHGGAGSIRGGFVLIHGPQSGHVFFLPTPTNSLPPLPKHILQAWQIVVWMVCGWVCIPIFTVVALPCYKRRPVWDITPLPRLLDRVNIIDSLEFHYTRFLGCPLDASPISSCLSQLFLPLSSSTTWFFLFLNLPHPFTLNGLLNFPF